MVAETSRSVVDYAKILEKYGKFKRPLKKHSEEEEEDGEDGGFLIQFRLSKAYSRLEKQEIEAFRPTLTPYRRRSTRRRQSQDEEERRRKEEEEAALRAKRRKEKELEKLRNAKPKKLSFWQMMKKTQAVKKNNKKNVKEKLTRENDPRYSKNFKPLWYGQKQNQKNGKGQAEKLSKPEASSKNKREETGVKGSASSNGSKNKTKENKRPETPIASIQEEPAASESRDRGGSSRHQRPGKGSTFLTQESYQGQKPIQEKSVESVRSILKRRSSTLSKRSMTPNVRSVTPSVADGDLTDSEYPEYEGSLYSMSVLSDRPQSVLSRAGSARWSTHSSTQDSFGRSQSMNVFDRPDSRLSRTSITRTASVNLDRDNVKTAGSTRSLEQRLKGISFSHTSTKTFHPMDRPGSVSQEKEEKGTVAKQSETGSVAESHRQVAQYLYHMCNCHQVSKHTTLSKLTKKRQVSGVIEIYGCPESDLRETVCPFCSIFPKRRVQAWLESTEGEAEPPQLPPFNPYTCYKVSS